MDLLPEPSSNYLCHMRTIIIDDEVDSLESLSAELQLYCPDIEIVAVCDSAEKGRAAILAKEPELVFLDIEMPFMNGFELLESLDEIFFDIIFVTAYDEYAVRAFDFNVVDYILKPIIKINLIRAVEKVQNKTELNINQVKLQALINNINIQAGNSLENIALPSSTGFIFVHISEIIYIKSESNYTWVFINSGEKYLLSKTLKECAKLIPFPQFFRSHRSFLVNMNYVKQYIKGQGGYLILKDGTNIPVSRKNRNALIRFINRN